MPLLRTRDVIEMLQQQDPDGTRIVYFRIYDETSPDDLVASGEVDSIELTLKDAYQTIEGDQKVIRIGLQLDCEC